MRIAQEEVFGPVLSVIPFDDEAEAVAIGNDIVYGLAAGVWTSDIGRALENVGKLKAGSLGEYLSGCQFYFTIWRLQTEWRRSGKRKRRY